MKNRTLTPDQARAEKLYFTLWAIACAVMVAVTYIVNAL